MNYLPQDIKEMFYNTKPTFKEDLIALEKAAKDLDNDPEFMKEYQEDLQKELDLSNKNQ